MRRYALALLIVLALALVTAACSAPQITTPPPQAAAPTTAPAVQAAAPTAAPAAKAAAATAAPAAAAKAAGPVAALASGFPNKPLQIMAPASPGGGWDLTSRELARVISEQKLAPVAVEVYNKPGAGGTLGLAELINNRKADPYHIMTMGLVMVGNILTNKAPVTLKDVTPLARLTTEYEGIAVRTESPFKTVDDLVAAFKKDPKAFKWGGGSAGGTDHILVALLAKAAGVDAKDINYIAYSGGGELTPAILSGAVDAGVSGLSEFKGQVDGGKMRVLAVSSEKPLDAYKDVPSLKGKGLDVVISNWRGIVAAPGIKPEERAWLQSLLKATYESQGWQDALKKNGWEDAFLIEGYEKFLQDEDKTVSETLKAIGLAQ